MAKDSIPVESSCEIKIGVEMASQTTGVCVCEDDNDDDV